MASAEIVLTKEAESSEGSALKTESALLSLENALASFPEVEVHYARIEGWQIDSTAVVNQIESEDRLRLYDAWLKVKRLNPSIKWDFDVFDRRDSIVDLPDATKFYVTDFSRRQPQD